MQRRTNVLLAEIQAVCTVFFEVLPDLFDGIEFWRVSWEPLKMEARVSSLKFRHSGPFVNLSLIPQEENVASEMVQKRPEKLRDVASIEVLLLKTHIKSHVLADG